MRVKGNFIYKAYTEGRYPIPLVEQASETRVLGQTGREAPLFSLGGQGILENPKASEEEFGSVLEKALELGVSYFDTAALYGPSQGYLGSILPAYRNHIFLASKVHKYDRDSALRLLDESLEQLQTDYLDLWQLHSVTDATSLDQIFEEGGAIEAMEEAKSDGRVLNLGITGHVNAPVLLRGLKEYPFDSILLALNPADRWFNRFIDILLPEALRQNIAVIAMKVLARGALLDAEISVEECIRYVGTLPISTMIIGAETPQQVEQNQRLASSFRPMSPLEMRALEDSVASSWKKITFYRDWVDGTDKVTSEEQRE